MDSVATPEVGKELKEYILEYKENYDPLYMMQLLVELLEKQWVNLSEEDYRQFAGCHNLLAAIVRNE
jgi:hypothetical protein